MLKKKKTTASGKLVLVKSVRRTRSHRMKFCVQRGLGALPHHKQLEEFDFTFQPSIDKRQIEELGTLAFVARKENVIFLGPSWCGKSALVCRSGS